MFIATVIVLISCVEITSSRSTVQICSVFSSIKHANDGSVVRTDYKLVQFQLQQLYGEIVQLQSALNDDYNNVSGKNQTCTIFQSQKLEDFFSQNLCHFVHFRAAFIDSFNFAMKRCNALQGFGAFFVQSCDRFLFPFYLFLSLFSFFRFFLDMFFNSG